MSMFKEMQFPVSVRWRGGGLTYAEAHGERLEVATPPEFRSGLAGYWSPEDLLVVAVTSCISSFPIPSRAIRECASSRLS